MSYECSVQPLHGKSPSFIGDKKNTLSWMEQPKKPAATAAGLDANSPIFIFLLNILHFLLPHVLFADQREAVPTCYEWEWPFKEGATRGRTESACEQSF